MSFESPISVLQNLAGEEVAVTSGSALGSVQPGVAVLAKDGSGNAQFLNMNASGELLVNAAVDVSLTASSDSVTVHGNRAALLQDAADDVLLVRDNDAADAIDAASTAISGAVAAMDSNLGDKLDTLDGSVGAVESAVSSASTAISGAITGFQTAFEAEDFASEATLAAFKDANHTDLVAASAAITGSIAGMNSDLGGKLDTLDGSVDAVATAVGTAEAGIVSALTGSVAGAISTMDSNLGDKLDTLDSSVGASKDAVDAAKAAITGSIEAFKASFEAEDFASEATLDAFKTAFEAEDFASETTLAAFKADNRSDLQAVSGSIVALGADLNAQLEQFTFNASGSLKVEADVNVTLAYGDDSVTVYGSQGQALVQDASDNKLLVRDTNAKDAIDLVATAVGTAEQGIVAALTGSVSGAISTMDSNLGDKLDTLDGSVGAVESAVSAASTAITGSIAGMDSNLGGKLDTLDGSVGAVESAVSSASTAISGSVVALGADLNAFASANHTDLDALNTSVGAVESAVSSASTAISGSIVALGAELSSQLDQFTFNASGSLKVEADVNVQLTYGDDSVTSHQGGTWDVSVNNFPAVQAVSQDGAPWSVTATDLDIRDLVHTQDSVKIYGDEGVAFAQISGSGEMITIPLGNEGNSFLQSASGSIWTDADGNGALLVGLLGSNSKNVLASNISDQLYVEVVNPFDGVVTATALDIRPLTDADVVTVDGFSTFASANHTDIEAVGTAVGAAEAGIVAALTGSVAEAIAAIDAAQLGELDIRNLDETSDRVNVFGTDASNNIRALKVDGSGHLITRKKEAGAFVSSKVASTTAETIPANADRMGATFFMDGNATCYIKLGSGASSTDFSVRLVNNGYYELPEGYTGEISVAFSVNDNALKLRITELTYA
jgi:hypothetical protein